MNTVEQLEQTIKETTGILKTLTSQDAITAVVTIIERMKKQIANIKHDEASADFRRKIQRLQI